MYPSKTDALFAGTIPQLYERLLVPLIFEAYAADMAARAERYDPARVLETAAGTGVVTRQLARALPAGIQIVATDLNQAMLDQAAVCGTARPLTWLQADAAHLPFPDASFDLVVCQFGVMFFPDKARAYAEARRVLRPGGKFIFSAWDELASNEFPATVHAALTSLFPDDPPQFLARTPYAYHDTAAIRQDLGHAGFGKSPEIETVTALSHAASPEQPALAFCQGTPLRGEIEARNAFGLPDAIGAATAALAERFGTGDIDGKIQAHVITAER